MEKAMEFKRFIETSLNTHGRVALVLHSFDKTYCTRFFGQKITDKLLQSTETTGNFL